MVEEPIDTPVAVVAYGVDRNDVGNIVAIPLFDDAQLTLLTLQLIGLILLTLNQKSFVLPIPTMVSDFGDILPVQVHGIEVGVGT